MTARPREIGATGVRVFPVGWGPMPLSLSGRPDEDTAMTVCKTALESGIDFWDTADAYCIDDREPGHNERLIAKALKRLGAAGRIRVASKGGMTRPGGSWVRNGRPEHLRKVCEQSLRNLGVERIFLYQLHWPDPAVPYAESVGALADLQREGKIGHVGISNVTPELLREAISVVRVESVQNQCGPFEQGDFSNGLVALCAEKQVTYIPYSPMGGSAGSARTGAHPLLKEVAAAYRATPYQAVLAWLLGKGGSIVPIPGGSRPASVTSSAAAGGLTLSAEHMAAIDSLAR